MLLLKLHLTGQIDSTTNWLKLKKNQVEAQEECISEISSLCDVVEALYDPHIAFFPSENWHFHIRNLESVEMATCVLAIKIGYDEARMKIYSVSTRCYYAFGALMSEELCYKINDSFCIHTPFGSNPNDHFFVVFDGHGEFGPQCSQFVKQRLCENLLRNSRFHSDLYERDNSNYHIGLWEDTLLSRQLVVLQLANPEIIALELTPDDLFFVIASDEVFEFLSSQVVVDMERQINSVTQHSNPFSSNQLSLPAATLKDDDFETLIVDDSEPEYTDPHLNRLRHLLTVSANTDEQNRKQIVSNGHESVLTSCNNLVLPKLNISPLRGFQLIDSNTYDPSVIDDNNWQYNAHSYFFHDDSRTNKRHHKHAVRQTARHWLTDLDGKKTRLPSLIHSPLHVSYEFFPSPFDHLLLHDITPPEFRINFFPSHQILTPKFSFTSGTNLFGFDAFRMKL
ncbi:hypothetical protein L6452_09800 [Arctium lappa]|uniref:Uncharacterized protein n=1 Tax=Arctium lappa TaxID=4217 RepID=A0ACB9DLH3_ARCLA|nr:hypothetical protein L6452_09800 [Arctium lappa]